MIACHKRLKMLVFSQHIAALVAVQKIKKIYNMTLLSTKKTIYKSSQKLGTSKIVTPNSDAKKKFLTFFLVCGRNFFLFSSDLHTITVTGIISNTFLILF